MIFLTVSGAFGLKVCKSANMTQKKFVQNIFHMGVKNAEFDADFEFVEKVAKSLYEETKRAENYCTQC